MHLVQLMPLHPQTPFKSRLVLTFWHRLTQVVLEKRPLNRCSFSSGGDGGGGSSSSSNIVVTVIMRSKLNYI